MKKFVPFAIPRPKVVFWAAAIVFSASTAVHAQTVEKMADFRNVILNSVYVGGSSNPYDNAVQIGNQLWFTTQAGGANDRGTISYYDLTTRTVTAYVSMDVTSGNTPLSSITPVGNQLYFTTTRGGTGDTGTLASVATGLTNPTITPLYNFGASTTTTNPRTPAGGFTAIAQSNGSTDLYFTTSNGGTAGSAYGTIAKYNTGTGAASILYNFTGTGAGNGRQPMEGFTNIGGKLYFTTFTGGATTGTGIPNGTGTLSVFDPATSTVSTLASMPVGNGQFPSHNVTQASNGLLYFTTAGTSLLPGSIQSFNLSTGTLSTVYALTGAATSSGPFPDGKQAYGSVFALNNVLYFTTITGGTYNRGTIDAFNLNTNTFTKLYDLDGGTADNVSYLGQEARGGFTLVNENGQDYLYLLTRGGGLYNTGTLLRITPLAVPEPGTMALLLTAGAGGGLLWRRRRRRGHSAGRESVGCLVPPRHRRHAFTLLELLIVIGIVAVLTGLALPVYTAVTDRGREAACLSNLRQIGTAYLSYAQDHSGYFPSAEAVGNSSYRSADDPLGLPMIFIPYLGGERKDGKLQGTKIWLCPGGRPSLKAYGANYAWTRADNVVGRPMIAIDHLSTTVLLWDNFTMTLPSVMNVPEGTTGGPRAASEQYRYYAHRTRTKANYLYADGHAGTL